MNDRFNPIRLLVLAALIVLMLGFALVEIISIDRGPRVAEWRVLGLAMVSGLAFSALVRLLDGSLSPAQRFWPGWKRVVGGGVLVGAALVPFVAALFSEQTYILLWGTGTGFLLGVTFLYPLPERQQRPPRQP